MWNHMIKGLSIVVGLLCIIALTCICAHAGGKPITIGYVGALSGPIAMYGVVGKIGGELAVEEINKAGGVLGRPLKQIARDDKFKPDVGLREAEGLVMGENVDFLTGTQSSASAQAISEYCKQKKKMFIITVAKSARITGELGHRYVFRFTTNSTAQAGTLGKAAAEKWGHKKVFVLGPDYEFGHQSKKDFCQYYKKQIPDLQIVGESWPRLGTVDFGAHISMIMASDADLFYNGLFGGMGLTFCKQAVPYGLYEKKHVADLGAGDHETWVNLKKGDPAPIGVLSGSVYPYWAIGNPKSIAFVKNFQKTTGEIPNYAALSQYTIIYSLKESIEAVGSVDTEKIIDYWKGRVFNTIIGPIEIRACDNQAMAPTWMGTMGWGDGLSFPHIVNVKKVESIYESCSEIEEGRKAQRP